jgi:hypothetical protein
MKITIVKKAPTTKKQLGVGGCPWFVDDFPTDRK